VRFPAAVRDRRAWKMSWKILRVSERLLSRTKTYMSYGEDSQVDSRYTYICPDTPVGTSRTLRITISRACRIASLQYSGVDRRRNSTGCLFLCFLFPFYRAMHVVLARYCYRKSSVRPSVRLSVCDVDVSWAYRLD